jgi:hypothetical protein
MFIPLFTTSRVGFNGQVEVHVTFLIQIPQFLKKKLIIYNWFYLRFYLVVYSDCLTVRILQYQEKNTVLD